ncbi:MAG: hypothetical protein H6672_23045, partial [Anaerolineaceae bacterium]|nr:hypothetical protein [Anaerolineaceae bacterium]
ISHLILLGTPERQPLTDEFVTGSAVASSVYQQLGRSAEGLLQESLSARNPNFTVLIITGNSEAGFDLAANAVYNNLPLVVDAGSIAVVSNGLPPRVIYREAPAATVAP